MTQEEAGAGVPAWAEPDVGPVLVDAERLAARVAELGAQITADYADEPPLLVAVLKGAMLFMSDLCRAIALPVDVDFMAVSSYGSATRTSGVVRIVKDLDSELEGRHVLVVEDIIDSGLTLNYLRRYLHARQPKSVEVCALLVKEGEQRVELDLRYVGFTIPPEFVVGYGLDVGRALPQPAGVSTATREARLSEASTMRAGARPPWPSCSSAIGEDPDRDGLVGHARPGGRHVRGALLGPARRPGPAPRGDLRRRARRDGDGARHPLRLAVRAPPGAVPRQGPRRLHPGRGRPHHRALQAGPPGRRLRPPPAGPRAHDDRRSPTPSTRCSRPAACWS